MYKLLFVDDEEKILKSLKRMLLDTDYELYTAKSGEEALEILGENPDMDLIISDMRMPIMDGFQLLSLVKKRYPRTVRVILSGYTDEKNIFKALQDNIAKLYMLKPWSGDEMLKMIEHVFETEKILENSSVVTLINNGMPFTSVSSSYHELFEMVEAGDGLEVLVAYIEKDLVMAANILRIANSAFYNANTGSIRQALLKIGKNGLHTFLLTASFVDSLSLIEKNKEYLGRIWNHAFLTNKIYTFIYEEFLGRSVQEISSSAGLLHKIGIVAMLHSYGEDYIKLLIRAERSGMDLLEEERKLYNADHAMVGAYLLDGWDFPYPIIESALYYAVPTNPQIVHYEVVCAVHVAQYYAGKLALGGSFTELCPEAFTTLKVNRELFEKKLAKIDWLQ